MTVQQEVALNPTTRSTRQGCVAASALIVLLTATGPQAHAADFGHPPEQTVVIPRQAQVPTDEGRLASPYRQDPADDVGKKVGESIFNTLIMIGVGAVVCVMTGICIVTM